LFIYLPELLNIQLLSANVKIINIRILCSIHVVTNYTRLATMISSKGVNIALELEGYR